MWSAWSVDSQIKVGNNNNNKKYGKGFTIMKLLAADRLQLLIAIEFIYLGNRTLDFLHLASKIPAHPIDTMM